jgi:hypothetical protein
MVWFRIALLAGALGLIGSCGYYSTGGRTAGDIQKVAVPYLANRTSEPEIEIEITQRIIDELVRDNTLKVVPEEEADGIIEGIVVQYQNVPFTFNKNPDQDEYQAEQYRLLVGIEVSLFDRKTNTYIWQNKKLTAHGDYYLETTSDQTYERALSLVYKDLVDGILGATVQEW